MFEKHQRRNDILSKDAGFASKNQLSGLSISGTLVENVLTQSSQLIILQKQFIIMIIMSFLKINECASSLKV